MKKILLAAAVACLATTGASAQMSDVQHAVLNTQMNHLIALRPYNYGATSGAGTSSTVGDNQSLSTTITDANAVLTNNNFDYTGNNGYNGLAYRIYSNSHYTISLQANATGSGDELNNYIFYSVETLPSPQNGGLGNNGNNFDHVIDAAGPTQLAYATTASGTNIIHLAAGANTGAFNNYNPYLPLDPVNTDFAAFGIKFRCSPGFSVLPGTYTTDLTITATSL